MSEITFIFYHRSKANGCDDNSFETAILTLRKYSDCKIVAVTDDVPEAMREYCTTQYGVEWIVISPNLVLNRRATCKIEILENFVRDLSDGDHVLVSDLDVYFMGNPFEAFREYHFDVGLTTRGYEYFVPVNGGVFYINCNEKSREWLQWHVYEIHNMKWSPYVARHRRNRRRFGLDWTVGQDFLIACYQRRDEVLKHKGITITDVTCKYNYCPPTDIWHARAFEAMRTAYKNKTHVVLHLKAQLKRMLYEGLFEDAVTRHPKL